MDEQDRFDRVVGTVTLFIIVYLYTGELHISLFISGTDIISNTILYYLHERAWSHISWGRVKVIVKSEQRKRSILKTITWRILASAYLIILSFFFTQAIIVSTKIALTDAIANLIEYYFHERIWNRIKWGKTKFI